MTDLLAIVPGVSPWGFLFLAVLPFFTSIFGMLAGQGGGILLLAGLSMVLPPAATIPVHGVIQLCTGTARAVALRKYMLTRVFLPFVLGAAVGAAVGGQLFRLMPTAAVQAFLALFILYACWGPNLAGPSLSRAKFGLLGLFGSFLGMFVGAAGVLIAPFVKAASPDRRNHTATLSALMSTTHVFKLMVFGFFGFSFAPYLPLLAAMILFGLVGNHFGKLILDRMDEKLFTRIFQVVLTFLALRLLYIAADNWGAFA